MQVNESKLKELLDKVNIEEIDSACPENQDSCPEHQLCTICWTEYLIEKIW